jgi:hypothetical protein
MKHANAGALGIVVALGMALPWGWSPAAGALNALDKVINEEFGCKHQQRITVASSAHASSSSVVPAKRDVKYTADPSGNPPGIMYSTLLNGVKIQNKTGELEVNSLQFVFLPKPEVDSYRPYDPAQGGELYALLKNSQGQQLARYDMYAKVHKAPYWVQEGCEYIDASGNKVSGKRGPVMESGSYFLDFYVAGKHFYHFLFAVSKKAPRNAFQGSSMWFLDGPWEDWGYFYYSQARPEQNLIWKVWLRNKEPDVRGIDVKVNATIYRGGTSVCTSPPATHNLKPMWNRWEFQMSQPMQGTSGGRYFKAKDLLARDGAYELKMTMDGKPYGTWRFAVKDGQLTYVGQTLRSSDAKTFVEGGLDAWWYKK